MHMIQEVQRKSCFNCSVPAPMSECHSIIQLYCLVTNAQGMCHGDKHTHSHTHTNHKMKNMATSVQRLSSVKNQTNKVKKIRVTAFVSSVSLQSFS